MGRSRQSSAVCRLPESRLTPTDQITEYLNNARVHPESQIRKIMASISEFGFINPLLVDEHNNLFCGHGRLEALRRLGWREVPTLVISHLSDAQRRAYVITDNALAEKAGWSKKTLAIELQGLLELGYNVELTGLDTLEIDTLLSVGDESADAEEEPIELPNESISPITQLGDHWIIGRHHLLCADARFAESYERLLVGRRAELVITDPPYNTSASRISGMGRVKHGDFVQGSGELTDGAFVHDLLRPTLRCIARFSDPGAIGFIFCDWRMDPLLREAAEGVLHEQKNLIVWVKTNAGMGSFYRSQHELVQAWKISRGPTINNFGLGEGGRRRSNVWTYRGANVFRRGRMDDLNVHPTVKPKRLFADALRDCSRPGGIVLDPFLGSGTLLAAAEITGRCGCGLELDPVFCDVILHRLSKETGLQPMLENGKPFDQVAAEREMVKSRT